MASITGMLSAAAPAISVPKLNPSRRPAGGTGLVVECSSRPQKKATAHHMKTRPKKTQPWDVRRKGPTAYPPLPPLPSDWTLVSDDSQPPAQPAGDAEPAPAL